MNISFNVLEYIKTQPYYKRLEDENQAEDIIPYIQNHFDMATIQIEIDYIVSEYMEYMDAYLEPVDESKTANSD